MYPICYCFYKIDVESKDKLFVVFCLFEKWRADEIFLNKIIMDKAKLIQTFFNSLNLYFDA